MWVLVGRNEEYKNKCAGKECQSKGCKGMSALSRDGPMMKGEGLYDRSSVRAHAQDIRAPTPGRFPQRRPRRRAQTTPPAAQHRRRPPCPPRRCHYAPTRYSATARYAVRLCELTQAPEAHSTRAIAALSAGFSAPSAPSLTSTLVRRGESRALGSCLQDAAMPDAGG